jgi:hypothetical protein
MVAIADHQLVAGEADLADVGVAIDGLIDRGKLPDVGRIGAGLARHGDKRSQTRHAAALAEW